MTDLKTNLTQKQLGQLTQLVTFTVDRDGVLCIKDVKGNVKGDVKGSVEGDVGGSVEGDVWGNVEGGVWGNVKGDVWGYFK